MLLSEAVDHYLLRIEFEGLSPNTIRSYRSPLRAFTQWANDPPVDLVTEPMVYRYLQSLSKLRPRSRRGRLGPLRCLYQQLVERKTVAANPFLTIKLPKKDAVRRLNVTEEESRQLFLAAGRHPDPKTAAQQAALLACLVFGGFRRSELLQMTLRSIDVDQGKITVIGKGQKERSVWVCQEATQALARWLQVRPPCDHDNLWIIDHHRRMGDGRLNKILDNLWVGAGLGKPKELRCHSLRHATATRWCQNGVDLRAVQDMLGHACLSTTADYLHSDNQRVRSVAALTGFRETPEGPGSNLNWRP